MNKVILTVLVLVLVGCSTQKVVWYPYKEIVTAEQFDKDRYVCQRDATYTKTEGATAGSAGYIDTSRKLDLSMLKSCFRARGYEIRYE